MSFGNIQVVTAGDTKFTNAVDGDMCIFTDTNAQKICLGTLTNAVAAVTLSNSMVSIPNLYSPGSIVQMGYARINTMLATTSMNYVASPITISFTPKFASSLLIARAEVCVRSLANNAQVGVLFQMRRDNQEDSTLTTSQLPARLNIHTFNYTNVNPGITSINTHYKTLVANSYNANATTQTTFTIWCASYAGDTIEVGNGNGWGRSDIYVYEIAQ